MAKKEEVYVVALRRDIDTLELVVNSDNAITLNPKGELIHNGQVVGDIAPNDVYQWVLKNNQKTFTVNPPKADIRVSVSVVGTYGSSSIDVVTCTKIESKKDNEEEGLPKKKSMVKKTYTLEFKGANSVNPGKVALIDQLNSNASALPTVKFARNDQNEVELIFNKEKAGKTAITEEIRGINWESVAPDMVKSMKAADMKIVIDIEIAEAEKIDYTEVIKLGISVGMSQEQVEKRINVFENRYYLSKQEIEAVAKSWKPVKPEGMMYIPDIDSVNYVDGKDRSLYYLLGYYAEEPNKNLRLVGIQSTGKNTLVEQLASLLWKPLLQLSCSRETSREDFEGAVTIGHKVYKHDKAELEKTLLDASFTPFQKASMLAKITELSSENVVQTLEFLKEPLVIGAIEGWWVLLDEINLTSSSVTSRFHSLLDYRREITVPKLGTVKAAEGFAVIATMNPNSFVGASNMNQALETRFRTLELAPRAHIADILKTQCPKASDSDIKALDNLYDAIFTEVANEKLPDSFLSVRNFIDALNIKGFAPLKHRVLHNIAHISVNEPDANKIVGDLIDTLF